MNSIRLLAVSFTVSGIAQILTNASAPVSNGTVLVCTGGLVYALWHLAREANRR